MDQGREGSIPTWIHEYWRLARILIVDAALFLTVMAILLLAFEATRILQWLGYPKEEIEDFVWIHSLGYKAVITIFILDMIYKLIARLLGRVK